MHVNFGAKKGFCITFNVKSSYALEEYFCQETFI